MKLKAVLFDLDGTLLPMDMDVFVNGYFKFLVKKMLPHGYEPDLLIRSVWKATGAMVTNDGSCTNEDAFWKAFCGIYGEKALQDRALFEEFYENEFREAKGFCGYEPLSAKVVRTVREKGLIPVLATNPLFPATATRIRIGWAGLSPEDFAFYTTYENIGYCKPNPEYYREVIRRLDISPEECLMVGNDVGEDMVAETLGAGVYLVTDWMINKTDRPLSDFPHGSMKDLLRYCEEELEPCG